MLIQVRVGKTLWNVYIEQPKGNLLYTLRREDTEYIRHEVKQCVVSLISKYHFMYGESEVRLYGKNKD